MNVTHHKRALPVSVLLFHPADGFGGAERTSTNIVRLSDPKKLSYVVVAGPKAIRPRDDHHFISLFDSGVSNGFTGLRRAVADARKLYLIARREQCRVAVGMLHYGALVVVLIRLFSLFRIKSIASPRTPSVLGIEFHVGRSGWPAFKWRTVVKFFCRFADRVVVASHGLRSECIRVFGAKPARVVVIPNGIVVDDRDSRTGASLAPAATPDVYRIATVGRLAPEKDLGTLLRAFAIARQSLNALLWVVGEGPELESLRKLADKLGIGDSVEFVGFNSDPFSVVRSADVFVHTALFEGFGNVILEAMASGVPVIATDCDFGPREIIRHGENGLLAAAADADRLAAEIVALCNDAGMRSRLVREGYDTVKHYNVTKMVNAYEKTILELAGVRA